MSKETLPDPEQAATAATAGARLRAAREAQGIDLGTLAAMLKIPLRKLEALEEDRHDDAQGPTFARALAQAACRALKIDPKPILALMPHHAANTLEQVNGGLNAPFRERGGRSETSERPAYFRLVVIVPALLVIAALALFYLPPSVWWHVGRNAVEAPAETLSMAPAAVPIPAQPRASDPAGGASTPAAASSLPQMDAAASAPIAAMPATPVVDEVLAHTAAPVGVPVLIKAASSSWVEVVDAQGRALLSRTVLAGESVGLDGVMPMRVKIGNAAATAVSLRGENVDLAPWTRDNVARLELK